MHAFSTLSILALAGSTVAAPGNWGGWSGYWGGGNRGGQSQATPTDVAVVTAYTTVTYGGNWGQPAATPTPTPQPAPAAPSPAAPEVPAPQAPASSPAASPTAAPAASGNTGTYMDVVETWRGKLGLSSLTQDDKMQANAQKTVDDSAGQMVHELNPGSFAQVLAPGDASDFEKVFVGGWLCERPDLPGLDGICSTMSQGWSYNGETGHADILTSGSYSKIGCALNDGIWGCDLS